VVTNMKEYSTDKYPSSELTSKIIGAAIEVHKQLGPGFLEYVYEEALAYELKLLKIPFERQFELDIFYKDIVIPKKYRADLFVDKKVIVELKASKKLTPNDEAQLLHYLKATKTKVGLLLAFGNYKLEIARRVM